MIRYVNATDSLTSLQLTGFFEGWPTPPSPERHLILLRKSDEIVLAVESASEKVVGFITAITDGVLCAYIPLLEVLPPFRRQGIGKELVRRMLRSLEGLYMVDLLCDPQLREFYASLGMNPATGMMIRNYRVQSGSKEQRARGKQQGNATRKTAHSGLQE